MPQRPVEARDPVVFTAGVPLRTGGHVVGRISTDYVYEGCNGRKKSFVFGPRLGVQRVHSTLVNRTMIGIYARTRDTRTLSSLLRREGPDLCTSPVRRGRVVASLMSSSMSGAHLQLA